MSGCSSCQLPAGIGQVLVVSDYFADSIVCILPKEADTPAWLIGEVVPGGQDVTIEGLSLPGSQF